MTDHWQADLDAALAAEDAAQEEARRLAAESADRRAHAILAAVAAAGYGGRRQVREHLGMSDKVIGEHLARARRT